MGERNFILRRAKLRVGFVRRMIAEISDKMGTAAGGWFLASLLSLPLVWAAFRVSGKVARAVTLALAAMLSFGLTLLAVQQAFLDGENSLAVQAEMGSEWVAHQVTSGCLPVVLVAVVLGLRRGRSKPGPR